MNLFVLNLVFAVTWAALTGMFTSLGLGIGFVVGFVALWVTQPFLGGGTSYFVRLYRVVRLALFFVYELVISSVQVAWDVLTPQDLSSPRIIEMPLDVKTDTEILLVTNLISLTPGTLSLDVSPDKKVLKIHAMFAEDADAQVAQLKNGMERMVREVFEP